MIGRLLAPLRRGASAGSADRRPPVPRAPGPRETAPREAAPRETALLAPGEAFTPTRPKPGRRQAVGRQAELARILQALLEERAHVVLYSERGRGKTSLSNLVVEALRQAGTVVARHTCEAGSDFGGIVRGLARDLPASLLASPAVPDLGEGCEAALPRGEVRPHDVVSLLPRLACRSLVCLVDEFDRIEDDATRTRLADTIKQLSDRGVALLFLLVGVSENLEQILGQHPSIQRNLVAVPLPLLGDDEVAGLVATAGARAGFHFPAEAVARVTELARGMPYMAQLLGLRLAQAAYDRGEAAIREEDFDAALARLIEDAPPRARALYASLTAHGHDVEMAAALHWLATARQDRWGACKPGSRPGARWWWTVGRARRGAGSVCKRPGRSRPAAWGRAWRASRTARCCTTCCCCPRGTRRWASHWAGTAPRTPPRTPAARCPPRRRGRCRRHRGESARAGPARHGGAPPPGSSRRYTPGRAAPRPSGMRRGRRSCRPRPYAGQPCHRPAPGCGCS